MFRFGRPQVPLIAVPGVELAGSAATGKRGSMRSARRIMATGKGLLIFSLALPLARLSGVPALQGHFDDPLHYMEVFGSLLSMCLAAYPIAKQHEAKEDELGRRQQSIVVIRGREHLFDLRSGSLVLLP